MPNFIPTGEMCMVHIRDENREDGFRSVDIGNYYTSPDGEKVLIMSCEQAERYGNLLEVPIYIRKET